MKLGGPQNPDAKPGLDGVDEIIFEPRKATKSDFDFSNPLIISSIRF